MTISTIASAAQAMLERSAKWDGDSTDPALSIVARTRATTATLTAFERVITTKDATAWRTWIKARKLEQQRERRAQERRIDYYPSREALEVILDQTHAAPGGDFASVINRIIEEWAEFPGGVRDFV